MTNRWIGELAPAMRLLPTPSAKGLGRLCSKPLLLVVVVIVQPLQRLALVAARHAFACILAKRKLLAWCRWVRRVAKRHASLLFSGMLRCAKMIEEHLPGILAHWERGTTNAFMEALNSVFSGVKRKARGFRSTDNLITMLYFTAAKLRIPATH